MLLIKIEKSLNDPSIIILEEFENTKRGNQNPYIEEEQTTQRPKKKVRKDKQRSTKHRYTTKDRVTRTPLKIGSELGCSGRVSSFCSTSIHVANYVFITHIQIRCYFNKICDKRRYKNHIMSLFHLQIYIHIERASNQLSIKLHVTRKRSSIWK